MRQIKRIGTYLVLCALLGGLVLALAAPLITDCFSIVWNGWGTGRYLAAASGSGGAVCAISRRDGRFMLVTGGQGGGGTQMALQVNLDAGYSRVAGLYPASDGSVFLAVYQGETQPAEELVLYRQSRDGGTELLLRTPCTGVSPQERMVSAFFSSFSEHEGEVSFALLHGGTAQIYHCALSETGLTAAGVKSAPGAWSAAVLPDGALAAAGPEGLSIEGRTAAVSTGNQRITQLTQAGAGLFYIDSASLKVFYTDLTASVCREVMQLGGEGAPLDGEINLSLTQEGNVLLLREGRRLLLCRGDGVSDLTAVLYRPLWQCILILLGLAAGVLLTAALLWYFLCLRQDLQLPILLRWGVLLAAAALLCTEMVLRGIVYPAYLSNAEREAVSLLECVSTLALSGRSAGDETLPELLGESLSAAPSGTGRDVEVIRFVCVEEKWYLENAIPGLPAGSRAELSRWNPALTQSGANALGERVWFALPLADGDRVLTAALDGQDLVDQAEKDYQHTAAGLQSGALVLLALVVLLLAWVTRNLLRVTRGMEHLTAGETNVRVELHSGDELEGLAAAFNDVADTVAKMDLARNDLARFYLRFVPERVLSLLGKVSITEVDKTTFVSRRMSAMMVWFGFPERVYDSASRALFDNINEVIERTASVVSQKGGAVFNFAYNGYDVVLEGGAELAVSTAVAVRQEVLALNEIRTQAGRPPVTLHIALDVGDMMMGVVGDEQQMEPTAISSSFSTAKRLIDLCNRLDANILCTENIISGAEGYGSRYMGKCSVGGESVRVYEIFDGDGYDVRRAKQLSARRFSEGVYALYAEEFTQAKRIFLDLVHDNQSDGGARYYLYLADQLEQSPEQDISLDS